MAALEDLLVDAEAAMPAPDPAFTDDLFRHVREAAGAPRRRRGAVGRWMLRVAAVGVVGGIFALLAVLLIQTPQRSHPAAAPPGRCGGPTPGVISLAYGEGALWSLALRCDSKNRLRFVLEERDPTTSAVTATAAVPGGSYRVSAWDGPVWVAGSQVARVTRRAHGLADGLAVRPVGVRASQITHGPAGVWAIDEVQDRLYRLDPVSGRPIGGWTRPSPLRPLDLATFNGRGGDPRTAAVLITTWGPPLPGRPSGDRGRGWLLRIDPATRRVTARIRVGREPTAVVSDGLTWVANARDGTLTEVDLANSRPVGRTLALPGAPRGRSAPPIALAARGSDVWAAAGNRLWRLRIPRALVSVRVFADGSSVIALASDPATGRVWAVLQAKNGTTSITAVE